MTEPGQAPRYEDRTLQSVFTHDHFGPSTHQQVGLYAALVIEPKWSSWFDSETGVAARRPERRRPHELAGDDRAPGLSHTRARVPRVRSGIPGLPARLRREEQPAEAVRALPTHGRQQPCPSRPGAGSTRPRPTAARTRSPRPADRRQRRPSSAGRPSPAGVSSIIAASRSRSASGSPRRRRPSRRRTTRPTTSRTRSARSNAMTRDTVHQHSARSRPAREHGCPLSRRLSRAPKASILTPRCFAPTSTTASTSARWSARTTKGTHSTSRG